MKKRTTKKRTAKKRTAKRKPAKKGRAAKRPKITSNSSRAAATERTALLSLADKTTTELTALYEIAADSALRSQRKGDSKTADRVLALDIMDELARRGESTEEQEFHQLWLEPGPGDPTE